MSDFESQLRKSDIDAFGGIEYNESTGARTSTGKVRVVTLQKGMLLFKLTQGDAKKEKGRITPWWSPVKPYQEDYEGALGRYQQAKLNGIDMSAMVRYMSAVSVDWNDLDNYVQVELTDDCMAFWGTFKQQFIMSKEPQGFMNTVKAFQRIARVTPGAKLPIDLGVLEAWQLYIPNLIPVNLAKKSVIPAHDMVALGMALGFVV